MIKQESWRVESTEGSLRDRFTKNAEQFDALMSEMLAENERLKKLASQRGARMQILWDYVQKRDKTALIGHFPDANDWFDDNGVPK